MCIVCIANNTNRNVYMYLNTRIFPTTGYARVLLFMFIRRELGGTVTGCLFQFTYCAYDKLAKMYAKYFGHMTKMTATPIYGKNHLKIFFSRTRRPVI